MDGKNPDSVGIGKYNDVTSIATTIQKERQAHSAVNEIAKQR